MKKVPSYPKITTKTNITVTQNININSPKGLLNLDNSKKLFKGHKKSVGKTLNSDSRSPMMQKPKSNATFVQPHSANRRSSSGNISKSHPDEFKMENHK